MTEYTSSGKGSVPKVVFDTNIFVSSIFWEHGNPHHLVELAIQGKIKVFTSTKILKELADVLIRDFGEFNESVFAYLAFVLKYAKVVETAEKVDIVKEDSDDNKIIECSIACKADYIVSGDKHLLRLKRYKETGIISAAELIRLLRN